MNFYKHLISCVGAQMTSVSPSLRTAETVAIISFPGGNPEILTCETAKTFKFSVEVLLKTEIKFSFSTTPITSLGCPLTNWKVMFPGEVALVFL